jgi:SAM-dependent methyltransferase
MQLIIKRHPPPPLFFTETNNSRIKYFKNTNFFTVKKYDLIILRHVLEHTYDPVSLIQYLGKYLSDSGILYIEVPNLDSGCAKFFKKYCPLFYVPRHIFHFTAKSLVLVIDEAELNYKIGKNEIPIMGNIFAILTGAKDENFFVKIIGIFLYPFQLAIETFYNSSTCINAICRKQKNNS